uniref:Uncharacterized protein n=1 Tax=Malurus cyaneus samueli TaxID=2593467 RepID=A0A8C5TI02_9PASS
LPFSLTYVVVHFVHAFSPFQIFATEGTKLASALHALSDQVHDDDKPLLVLEAEKLISMCKELHITAKASAQGKSATFTKVDACILKTRNVMTLLCQLLPLCSKILRKSLENHVTNMTFLESK